MSDTESESQPDDDAQPTPDDETPDVEIRDIQRHRGGDETAILLAGFGDGWQVLAIDVDAGGQILDIEEIGDAADRESAVGMAEYWRQQHPNGVLGGEEGGGGGVMASLGNLFGGGAS